MPADSLLNIITRRTMIKSTINKIRPLGRIIFIATIFLIIITLCINKSNIVMHIDQQLLSENRNRGFYDLSLTDTQKQILSTIAENNTSNIVVNNLSTFTDNRGFTITVNDDGSFTYSGTNDSDSPVYITITPAGWTLPSGTYILSDSGGGQEPSQNDIYVFLQNRIYNIGGTTDYPIALNLVNGTLNFTIEPNDHSEYFLNLYIAPGFSSNEITFYPMITAENNTYSYYQPCVISNTANISSNFIVYDLLQTTKNEFIKLTDSDVDILNNYLKYQTTGIWTTIDFQDGTGLVYSRNDKGNVNTDNPEYGELNTSNRIANKFGNIGDITIDDKQLNDIVILQDYLTKLKETDYTILASVRDDGFGAINSSIRTTLSDLGLKVATGMDNYRKSYYAILIPGQSPKEEISDQELNTSGYLPDGSTYQIISRGSLIGNDISSILVNGQEWSMNRRGINFVIYDNSLHTVIDTVCFDTCDDLHAYRPSSFTNK